MFPDVNSKPIYCNAQHPRMTIAKMEKVQRACKKYSSFFITEKFEKTDKNIKTRKRLWQGHKYSINHRQVVAIRSAEYACLPADRG